MSWLSKIQQVGSTLVDINLVCGSGKALDSSTLGASLVAQTGENLPTVQETQVRSLGWEALLEKGMATPSSILVCEIPWAE